MILRTLIKELKELVRDGRARLAFLIVMALLGSSVWISTKRYKDTNQQYEQARSSERLMWDNQGAKNPHAAAHFGTYAFKPKYPLSLIDQGVDKYVGTSIFLEAHNRNEAEFSAASDQTGLARFGELTPDFVLLFLVPLLIILLAYNVFTKEREMGTLTLLKSQGLSKVKWFTGKWLALVLPILSLTLVVFILAGLVLSNLKDFGEFQWSALGTLFAVYAAYYVVFVNLVMFISARVRKSGTALVWSLSIWILACLAAPKAASNFADRQYPYPSKQEFLAAVTEDKKEGLDGHNPWSKEAKLLEQEVLKQYGVDSLHKLPFNFDAYRMQKGEEHEAEVYFKHYNYLKQQYKNQSKTYRSLALISPFLPARFLSMAIAHTDYNTHWDFADAAEEYRIVAQKFLNENFAKNSTLGQWAYQADEGLWRELPDFHYDPPALEEIVAENQGHTAVLSLWLVGSFVLSVFSVKSV